MEDRFSQDEYVLEGSGVKGALSQTTESKRTVSRIPRKKLAGMSRVAGRVIPGELSACGDVHRVADDWKTYAMEVRDAAIVNLLRRMERVEERLERERRVVSIDRRAA